MVSEAVVRRVIGAEGAEALVKITQGAWQDYIDEDRTRYHRSTRANIVWDYMATRCEAVLPAMDGVHQVMRFGRPMFVLRDRLLLRPKMHAETVTHNYPTAAQVAAQRSGLFDEYEYQVISFGYELDSAEADVEHLFVTSPADAWVINLEELASGEVAPVTYLLPGMEEDLTAIEPIRFGQNG